MIGDPAFVSVWDLSQLLDDDPTFAAEALALLSRDHVDKKSTYTVASSASALLNVWLQRGELKCYDERRQVGTDFDAILCPDGDGDYTDAQEIVERAWLVSRTDFALLVESYRMTMPAALVRNPQEHNDSTLLLTEYGYTVDGAAHALHDQWGADEAKWRRRIMDAVAAGNLRVRDPKDGAYYVPATPRTFYERISVADLNAWLAKSGTTFELDEAHDLIPSSPRRAPESVDRNRIIDGFPVCRNAVENREYWDDKLSRPPKWLVSARISVGKPGVSSRWDPAQVAHALVGKKAMTIRALDVAMKNFPDWENEWREQTTLDRD